MNTLSTTDDRGRIKAIDKRTQWHSNVADHFGSCALIEIKDCKNQISAQPVPV
jgi:hypothetical protein